MNTRMTATVHPEQHFVLSFTQDKRGYRLQDVPVNEERRQIITIAFARETTKYTEIGPCLI